MTDEEIQGPSTGGLCPVCGWTFLHREHIPENPDPDNGPDAPGTYYVHRREALGNGRVNQSGCSEYHNGETTAWDPPREDRQNGVDLSRVQTALEADRAVLLAEAEDIGRHRPHPPEQSAMYDIEDELRYRSEQTRNVLETEMDEDPLEWCSKL